MKVQTTRCARCQAELVIPASIVMPDEFVGCRLVKMTMTFMCGSCGTMLELDAPADKAVEAT